MQEDLLGIFENASTAQELQDLLPRALALVLERYKNLRAGRVRLADLVVHKRMSKELSAYRVRSAAAIAAQQLKDIGQPIRLGQRVPLVYTIGHPGACAWHVHIPLDPRSVNYAYYCKLLVRAASAILQPLQMDEAALNTYLISDGIIQIPIELL